MSDALAPQKHTLHPGRGDIVALVLAGGRGQRMGEGADKHARRLGGQSLLDRALERIAAQSHSVLISCNSGCENAARAGYPVLSDAIGGFPGPLAGVLAGLEYLEAHHPQVRLMATIAVDTPWFPDDLLARLAGERCAQYADIAIAVSGGREHPVFALWPRDIAPTLREALLGEQLRKVRSFQARYRVARVEWSAHGGDPFFNINTPAELGQAQRWLDSGRR